MAEIQRCIICNRPMTFYPICSRCRERIMEKQTRKPIVNMNYNKEDINIVNMTKNIDDIPFRFRIISSDMDLDLKAVIDFIIPRIHRVLTLPLITEMALNITNILGTLIKSLKLCIEKEFQVEVLSAFNVMESNRDNHNYLEFIII